MQLPYDDIARSQSSVCEQDSFRQGELLVLMECLCNNGTLSIPCCCIILNILLSMVGSLTIMMRLLSKSAMILYKTLAKVSLNVMIIYELILKKT